MSNLKRIAGPMLAGLVIDAIDLATFGPVGLYTGLWIGGAVGWWLAPELGFPPRGRWLCAALTGIYCTLPMTGFIPAATLGAGLTRALFGDDDHRAPELPQRERQVDAIDVDYRSEWANGDDPAAGRSSVDATKVEGTR